ncbi:uncharacterized protein MYCFIDRAFT_85113 [Pseudocercospora fijiensis CIRAD86]|uniref:Uncharacterized protein n=1 Tax=Pseudocercospora fijiensis (strain CIRAD86) TaxID=383855 RepID=M2ZE98_PSEFD|nr:uncharacterized protein MYCFIDRAFT_85113 [Pseudocercospora fijiensis CIRAD86]EME77454.1 hypothetical protein MYCFIDRAFT_85113 [Pseudocercospora fijiensis CIRAD86]
MPETWTFEASIWWKPEPDRSDNDPALSNAERQAETESKAEKVAEIFRPHKVAERGGREVELRRQSAEVMSRYETFSQSASVKQGVKKEIRHAHSVDIAQESVIISMLSANVEDEGEFTTVGPRRDQASLEARATKAAEDQAERDRLIESGEAKRLDFSSHRTPAEHLAQPTSIQAPRFTGLPVTAFVLPSFVLLIYKRATSEGYSQVAQ